MLSGKEVRAIILGQQRKGHVEAVCALTPDANNSKLQQQGVLYVLSSARGTSRANNLTARIHTKPCVTLFCI